METPQHKNMVPECGSIWILRVFASDDPNNQIIYHVYDHGLHHIKSHIHGSLGYTIFIIHPQPGHRLLTRVIMLSPPSPSKATAGQGELHPSCHGVLGCIKGPPHHSISTFPPGHRLLSRAIMPSPHVTGSVITGQG